MKKASQILPLLTLLTCLLIIVFLSFNVQRQYELRVQKKMQNLGQELESYLEARLNLYEDILHSGHALNNSNKQVTSGVWEQFVSTLRLDLRYPEILGVMILQKFPFARS